LLGPGFKTCYGRKEGGLSIVSTATPEEEIAMAGLGEKERRDHAMLVGVVTLGWNRAVHQLLRAFTHLTGVESPLADVIFFGSRSDNAQRQMLARVAKTVDLTSKERDRLIPSIRRLDKAAVTRNAATHTIFGVTAYDRVTDRWGAKVLPLLDQTERSRLKEDFEAQFREVESELGAIYQELEDWLIATPIRHAPGPDRRFHWRRRPRWRGLARRPSSTRSRPMARPRRTMTLVERRRILVRAV
jgi:hypothetical protein